MTDSLFGADGALPAENAASHGSQRFSRERDEYLRMLRQIGTYKPLRHDADDSEGNFVGE